jgi:hypothetical protein
MNISVGYYCTQIRNIGNKKYLLAERILEAICSSYAVK